MFYSPIAAINAADKRLYVPLIRRSRIASKASRVTFTSDGVSTYYIAVEGYNVSSVGAFNMEVTCTSVTPPAVGYYKEG